MIRTVTTVIGDELVQDQDVPHEVQNLGLTAEFTEVAMGAQRAVLGWELMGCCVWVLAGIGLVVCIAVPLAVGAHVVVLPACIAGLVTLTAVLMGVVRLAKLRAVNRIHALCEKVNRRQNVVGRAQFAFRSESTFDDIELVGTRCCCDMSYFADGGSRQSPLGGALQVVSVELNTTAGPVVPLDLQRLGVAAEYKRIVVTTAKKLQKQEIREGLCVYSLFIVVGAIITVVFLSDSTAVTVGVIVGLVVVFLAFTMYVLCSSPVQDAAELCETTNVAPSQAEFTLRAEKYYKNNGGKMRKVLVHYCDIKYSSEHGRGASSDLVA